MRANDPNSEQIEEAATATEVTELLAVLLGRANAGGTDGPVPPSQLRALFAIERQAGCNLRTLSEELGSTPPATSRLCDRLEAAGLVLRTVSPASRREVRLQLSRDGQRLLEEIRAGQRREINAVLRRMAPAARHELLGGLRAFREAATEGPRLGTTTQAETSGGASSADRRGAGGGGRRTEDRGHLGGDGRSTLPLSLGGTWSSTCLL
ncbi:MarR family transcriptional regulator [Streptomyces durbertensis]|uniref:MarR family transcriptional regulator n=1 Tax=Streptomyces durbertensis TaxID=2448886 RepID=A0ABR6EN70_9ACTN|nr:MarR family transcriptional regulator [Streptomyces durbertensis]MBB1246796.1 MarR family transcriptional regulator [Streptomyces durbertensis]